MFQGMSHLMFCYFLWAFQRTPAVYSFVCIILLVTVCSNAVKVDCHRKTAEGIDLFISVAQVFAASVVVCCSPRELAAVFILRKETSPPWNLTPYFPGELWWSHRVTYFSRVAVVLLFLAFQESISIVEDKIEPAFISFTPAYLLPCHIASLTSLQFLLLSLWPGTPTIQKLVTCWLTLLILLVLPLFWIGSWMDPSWGDEDYAAPYLIFWLEQLYLLLESSNIFILLLFEITALCHSMYSTVHMFYWSVLLDLQDYSRLVAW